MPYSVYVDVKKIKRQGHCFKNALGTLYWLPSGNSVYISVLKKYYKKAVDRNRIKRMVKESRRRHKDLEGSCLFLAGKDINLEVANMFDFDAVWLKLKTDKEVVERLA